MTLAFVSFAQFLLWASMSTVVSPFAFIPLGFSSAFSEDLGLRSVSAFTNSVSAFTDSVFCSFDSVHCHHNAILNLLLPL